MRPPRCSAAGGAIFLLVGLDLVGLAEVGEALLFGEGLQARQLLGGLTEPAGIEQDQPGGARPRLALGGGGELVPDPLDRRLDVARRIVAFDPEIPLPALAYAQPLDHRAHEGEVADVELARTGGGERRAGRSAQARQAL